MDSHWDLDHNKSLMLTYLRMALSSYMMLIKRHNRNLDDDNYFDKMLRINKKLVTYELSNLILRIAIRAAAMISNKKERKSG